MHYGQTHACAFSAGFCGEEWIEGPLARGFVHSHACVTYCEAQVTPCHQIRVLTPVSVEELEAGGSDFEYATERLHGVDGVCAEVHDYLVNLRRTRLNHVLVSISV